MTATTLKVAPFSRSRSSDSSASSLSSTFSDIIPSSISDSSSTSKTNAFFASPFSTRPPSPIHPEQKFIPPPTRSLTTDFFATPLRTPSPPKTTTTTVIRQRIGTRLPNDHPPSAPSPPSPALPRLPFATIQGPNLESSSNEPTPRPPDLEPTLLHFERTLLIASQENQKRNHQPQPEPESEPISDDDGEVEEEPHAGSIISLNTEHHPIPQFSSSPLSLTFANPFLQDDRGTPTPTNEPSSKPSKPSQLYCIYLSISYIKTLFFFFFFNSEAKSPSSLPTSPSTCDDFKSTPTLRLLRPLAPGAFSTVWLAEDLSRVPLTLVSKKSVRDLRRRVSGRDKERRDKESGRDKEVEILKDEDSGSRTDGFPSKPSFGVGPSSSNGYDISFPTSTRSGGPIHPGPNLSRHLSLRSDVGRLVAVKMTPRKVRGAKGKRERAEEERTRVGFVREVEVLKVSWVLFRLLWVNHMADAREVKASQ